MIPIEAIKKLIASSPSQINHLLINFNKPEEDIGQFLSIVQSLVDYQVKKDIPVLTLDFSKLKEDDIKKLLDSIQTRILLQSQIRVSVIGQWYDSDTFLLENIKDLMNKTREFDKHFLNILIKYDGQSEILSALQVILKKLATKQLKLADINKSIIKENIYSSYFLTPNIIIETGVKPRFSGSFLWDSKDSCIYYTGKCWTKFLISDIEKAKDFCKL